MKQIVITEFMDDAAVARFSEAASTLYDASLADAQDGIPALLGAAEALVVRNRTQVTAELLDAAPALKCVGRLGVGLDNIDVAACRARGVEVYPATGANDASVAEYVITTAMMLLRGAYVSSEQVMLGEWPRQNLIGQEIGGKTLGLVGFGSIARETASRAHALGMEIAAFDPFVSEDDPIWAMATRHDLDGLLASSDVLSLHVPLTEETRHMIGADALLKMKDSAIVINAARGGVVDEAALASALKSGQISGAGLDVFEVEPMTRESGAKFEGLNAILTPHIAGVTLESNTRVSHLIVDKVMTHLGLQQP